VRSDFELLGESAVWPGHPVTLGYLIFCNYPSLAKASVGCSAQSFPEALVNAVIPGAGGCVYSALDFLKSLKGGMSFEAAVDSANATWAGTDDQERQYPKRYVKGLKQAALLAARLQSEVTPDWLADEETL